MSEYSGSERRQDNINIHTYMELLVNNVKELFSTEVNGVKEQIQNLENKLSTQIENHADRSDEKIHQIESEISCLKTKVGNIDKRVEELEIQPTKNKAGLIDNFGSIFQKILYTVIASGIVGFLIFLIIQYVGRIPV